MQRNEGRERQHDVQRAIERAPADGHQRLQHDRDDGCLESHQYPARHRQAAEARIRIRETKQQQDGRPDEAEPGDQSAAYAVKLPAQVDGELQRFGPREQHAEIERARELLFTEPAAPLDDLAMHHRDLPRGTTERNQAQPQPESCRFSE